MRNIKLTVEYDGTKYCGWQRQLNGISIQEVIEKALKRILRQDVKLTGAGRTDSGVHARGQVANFKTTSRLTAKEFLSALNKNLPKDIAVKKAEEVPFKFNARFEAKSKLYRYTILNSPIRSPLEIFYSRQYRDPLNVKLMKKEAKALLGRHNFSSFQASGNKTRSSTRHIYNISVKDNCGHIYIDIEADGFLYNMVRNIAGTLIEIGRGKLKQGDMKKILKAKDRSFAGPTAQAKGLCLLRVDY